MGPKKINYDKDIRKLLEELQSNPKKGYERLFDKNCGNVILQEKYSSSNFERRFNQLSNVGNLEEFQKKYFRYLQVLGKKAFLGKLLRKTLIQFWINKY